MPVEILKPPSVAVLKASGINCDEETKYAFQKAGALAEVIHVNQLKEGQVKMDGFQIIVIPGGFSYGDDIASGRVMAIEFRAWFADEILEHIQKGRLAVGICNGFQVLMQTGLLPFGEITSLDKVKASLVPNDSGRFESRWIWVKTEEGDLFTLPVAHGEGKFVTTVETLREIELNGQVMLRYCTIDGEATFGYPDNPNGSVNAIAGICDPTGKIIGLMPHPERFVEKYHYPNWRRREKDMQIDGLKLLKGVVNLAKEL